MRTSSARTLMGCIPNKAPTRVQGGYNDLMTLDSRRRKRTGVHATSIRPCRNGWLNTTTMSHSD